MEAIKGKMVNKRENILSIENIYIRKNRLVILQTNLYNVINREAIYLQVL